MILIALGANLPHAVIGPPRSILQAAIAALEVLGVRIVARSRFYESVPVPVSDQPLFVNAVVAVATERPPPELMQILHTVEAAFGRVRQERNEARVLDLDLLAYDDIVMEREAPALPHPRLADRAFVLLPLKDVAPDWRHPVLGTGIDALIAALPPEAVQGTRAIAESSRP